MRPANTTSQRKLKYLALGLWLLVIFLFSNQVANSSSALSGSVVDTLKPYLPSFSHGALTFLVRKSAHIALYIVLGLLTYNVAVEYAWSNRQRVRNSLIFVVSYAALDEIHQLFRAGRSGEPRDVIIDTIAGLMGVGLYWFIVTRRRAQRAAH